MEKKWIIAFLFIVFLIGGFYNNKPYSQETVQNISEQIILPVKAHIIIDSSGYYTSARDNQNIFNLFEKVNKIWSQADISLSLEEIVFTEVEPVTIPNTINGNRQALYSHKNFDENQINIFFTQSLNGINGLALMDINSALVSDYTTVNDFRATSHEIGHIFGLRHVNPSNRLLARGKNGELLSQEEISIARENAENILKVIK